MTGEFHPIIRKWRENMKRPVEPDPAFEAFLRQEQEEIDEILVSLGWGNGSDLCVDREAG